MGLNGGRKGEETGAEVPWSLIGALTASLPPGVGRGIPGFIEPEGWRLYRVDALTAEGYRVAFTRTPDRVREWLQLRDRDRDDGPLSVVGEAETFELAWAAARLEALTA